ncbi:MAG: bifunctional adenosylcobinamide kinase/adenosylcobinamide-phosphate guanylyltransferase [Magnetococcus sp. MYC-9]
MGAHLVLGGNRSGKSGFAARQAAESGLPVLFVATAQAADEEMAHRIRIHKANRPAHWQVAEEPVHVADLLLAHAGPERFVLVDCLTIWLTNLLLHADPGLLHRQQQALFHALQQATGPVLLVGNETGLGITPMGALSRQFIDENGHLHQKLAQLCSRVTLVVAGLPLSLKGG